MNKLVPLQRHFVVFCIGLFSVVDVQHVAEGKGSIFCFLYFPGCGDHVCIKLKVFESGFFRKEIAEALAETEVTFEKTCLQGEGSGSG